MTDTHPLNRLLNLPPHEADELLAQASLGYWSQTRLNLTHAPLHWEWTKLAQTRPRLAVVAPREHAKSETFTVNQIAWRSIYTPGFQSYVFALSLDQAKKLKTRIDSVVEAVAPWLLSGPVVQHNQEYTRFQNYAEVQVAGAGKAVRGAHPDLIVGDDVLSEGNSMTSIRRQQTHEWWFGTIGGMSHPPTTRVIGRGKDARTIRVPGTVVHLVGTPFHRADLLMSMKSNPLYHFRRYAAEFDPAGLVPGTLAVEVS